MAVKKSVTRLQTISAVLTLGSTVFRKPRKYDLTSMFAHWDTFRDALDGRIILNVRLKTNDELQLQDKKLDEQIPVAATSKIEEVTENELGNLHKIRDAITETKKKRERSRNPSDKRDFNIIIKTTSDSINEYDPCCFE